MGVDLKPQAYRLRHLAGVALCAFHDAVVAFDRHAWETHIVDERAAIVLEALARGPQTQAALAELLASHARCAPEAMDTVARAALDELTAAGLVEGPAPGAAD